MHQSLLDLLNSYCDKSNPTLRRNAIKTLAKICLYQSYDVANKAGRILLNYRSISDNLALIDLAFGIKTQYSSESSEIIKKLLIGSSLEIQEIIRKRLEG